MAAYATVIFFDDKKALGHWFEKMPNRKDALTIWSKNGQGILQHTVWTAFATEGLGANLQHCTQVIPGADEAIRSVLDVPAEWEVSGTWRRGAGSEREREGSVAPASGWSERRPGRVCTLKHLTPVHGHHALWRDCGAPCREGQAAAHRAP